MTGDLSHLSFQWFAFPASTEFGRVLPKSKIYEYASPSPKVKELFVKQVEQIVWQHKLAPETLNISATEQVPEIQIFRLTLKTPEISDDVLSCIDKAIPFPVLYEVCFENRFQVVAAYKRPNATDNSKWLISRYFASNWQPVDQQRLSLPIVLDLAALYKRLLGVLVNLPQRPNESTDDWIKRTEQLTKLNRDISRLQSKLHNEKQFNRKVALHTELKQLQAQQTSLL
jgi:hypothetical protein